MTARERAHALVNWDGMPHCGPRRHSPTCDKATEAFAGLEADLSRERARAEAAEKLARELSRDLAEAYS